MQKVKETKRVRKFNKNRNAAAQYSLDKGRVINLGGTEYRGAEPLYNPKQGVNGVLTFTRIRPGIPFVRAEPKDSTRRGAKRRAFRIKRA